MKIRTVEHYVLDIEAIEARWLFQAIGKHDVDKHSKVSTKIRTDLLEALASVLGEPDTYDKHMAIGNIHVPTAKT